jgi:hypothetical protein
VVGFSGDCGSTELAGVVTSECAAASLGFSGPGDDDLGRGGTETLRTELGGVDGVDRGVVTEGCGLAAGLTDGIARAGIEGTAAGRAMA